MSSDLAGTPAPPYVAVIFTSIRVDDETDAEGYAVTAAAMDALVATQPGYLGQENARGDDGLGITVSYWVDVAAAAAWKQVGEHLAAQRIGAELYYETYRVRIATVERDYGL